MCQVSTLFRCSYLSKCRLEIILTSINKFLVLLRPDRKTQWKTISARVFIAITQRFFLLQPSAKSAEYKVNFDCSDRGRETLELFWVFLLTTTLVQFTNPFDCDEGLINHRLRQVLWNALAVLQIFVKITTTVNSTWSNRC